MKFKSIKKIECSEKNNKYIFLLIFVLISQTFLFLDVATCKNPSFEKIDLAIEIINRSSKINDFWTFEIPDLSNDEREITKKFISKYGNNSMPHLIRKKHEITFLHSNKKKNVVTLLSASPLKMKIESKTYTFSTIHDVILTMNFFSTIKQGSGFLFQKHMLRVVGLSFQKMLLCLQLF